MIDKSPRSTEDLLLDFIIRYNESAEKSNRETEEKYINDLCEQFGAGRIMMVCSESWASRDSYGALTVGPCLGMTVPCVCVENHIESGKCAVCCGVGRLTKAVYKMAKERL